LVGEFFVSVQYEVGVRVKYGESSEYQMQTVGKERGKAIDELLDSLVRWGEIDGSEQLTTGEHRPLAILLAQFCNVRQVDDTEVVIPLQTTGPERGTVHQHP